MQIAGTVQIIHQRHQITVRNRLVGAQKYALLLVTGGGLAADRRYGGGEQLPRRTG